MPSPLSIPAATLVETTFWFQRVSIPWAKPQAPPGGQEGTAGREVSCSAFLLIRLAHEEQAFIRTESEQK